MTLMATFAPSPAVMIVWTLTPATVPAAQMAVDVRLAVGVDVKHRFNARLRTRFGAQADFFR